MAINVSIIYNNVSFKYFTRVDLTTEYPERSIVIFPKEYAWREYAWLSISALYKII